MESLMDSANGQLSAWSEHQLVVDGLCSETKTINVSVPQYSVLFPTLHINNMLSTVSIHYYADA